MSKRGKKPLLSEDETQWAYEKWCEGYTQQQIADALFVCRQTINGALRGQKKPKPCTKPKLVYTGKMGA